MKTNKIERASFSELDKVEKGMTTLLARQVREFKCFYLQMKKDDYLAAEKTKGQADKSPPLNPKQKRETCNIM